jgi:hypothetical protein
MQFERRKKPRYAVADREIIVMCAYSCNVAAVCNIGAGGMQLQYVSESDRGDQWTRIDIFAGKSDRILAAGLGCRVAYDVKSLMEGGTFSGLNVRLCGLEFMELTQVQEIFLNQLIARRAACRNDRKR